MLIQALEFLICFFLILVVLGLIKPWWVFWWSDFSNRIKVLSIYGIILVLLILIRVLI